MVVGLAASGKTSCIHTLCHTVTELQSSKDPRFRKVDLFTLNPKSISMGELYGSVNPYTQDWHDGLASSIIRSCAED